MSVTTHMSRRTALAVLLSLGMVAMVVALQMAQPSEAQNQFAPSFKMAGEMGEPIEMREGTITVSNLRVAKTIATSDSLGDEKYTTSVYWVLVDYRFVQKRESGGMDLSLYSGDNARYRPSGRLGASSATTIIYGEPGFPKTGRVAFEAPKAALVGAKLVIGNNGAFGQPLWDDQAIIPLNIDRARAERLVEKGPATLTLKG